MPRTAMPALLALTDARMPSSTLLVLPARPDTSNGPRLLPVVNCASAIAKVSSGWVIAVLGGLHHEYSLASP
jgi:hypothetical protein